MCFGAQWRKHRRMNWENARSRPPQNYFWWWLLIGGKAQEHALNLIGKGCVIEQVLWKPKLFDNSLSRENQTSDSGNWNELMNLKSKKRKIRSKLVSTISLNKLNVKQIKMKTS
jgi:hypothetical protein